MQPVHCLWAYLSLLIHPEAGQGTAIIQQIGLAFFVYTVGIAAGSTFFSDLRKQTSLLGSATIICVVGAVVATIGGHFLGLGKGLVTGLYTGALTAAPALDAATRVSGDPQAAVGYAFGYPIGVIVGIVVVTMTVTRKWLGEKDTPSLAGAGLDAVTVRVDRPILTRKILAWREGRVRMSYLQREGRTRVLIPGEELRAGDLVVLVGGTSAIAEVVEQLGTQVSDHLADDRSDVAFERIVVSSPDVAGRAIVELNLATRFGATITRVRRGDLDLLARDDLKLNLGDHAAVVVPQEELDNVQSFLGDSERRVSEVDGMAFGIGMVLGMALGAIPFPMFGGATFQLGSAAGPLIVGMLLGALRRTGPLVWTLPASANITIRSVGLMLFLAALGLNAGPALVDLLLRPEGWKAAILATIIVAVCCAAQAIAGRYLGLSAPRTAGAVAGSWGSRRFCKRQMLVLLMSVSRPLTRHCSPSRSSSKFSWCHLSGHCELRSNSWQHRILFWNYVDTWGTPCCGFQVAPLSSYEAVMELRLIGALPSTPPRLRYLLFNAPIITRGHR